jgi:flavin reductase ActVB
MAVASASFRRALGQFASGVTVVTARDAAGQPLGLTVTAFCSVSLRPQLVLVCVAHRADTSAGMRESGHFAVSLLREDQADVSRRFAARGRGKLEGFVFARGRHGLPLVPGALAHVQCRIRSFHDEGDHAVWVGEVIAVAVYSGRPLLHFRGSYRHLAGPDGVTTTAAIEYKRPIGEARRQTSGADRLESPAKTHEMATRGARHEIPRSAIPAACAKAKRTAIAGAGAGALKSRKRR